MQRAVRNDQDELKVGKPEILSVVKMAGKWI